jgi:dolichol-phosphate mannosyltransferase
MQLSIVVPVFNEEDSLRKLREEIFSVADKNDYGIELIFVDDGSSDRSWKVIDELAGIDSRVRGIRFRRNFGKACALQAGMNEVRTEIVLTMDADLQDDPAEIPTLLEKHAQGFDVVSGWKKTRHDPIHKTFPSKIFNWMVNRLTGVKLHDHNCGFKLYRREIFDEVCLYGEFHRFIPVLAAARGWRVGEVIVHHRPREFGKSKYGMSRLIKGFLDLITVSFLTSYNHRPQHLLGTIGLFSSFGGLLGLTYLAGYWIFRQMNLDTLDPDFWPSVTDRALLYYSLGALLLGANLVSFGLLAELFVSKQQGPTTVYSIREKTSALQSTEKIDQAEL